MSEEKKQPGLEENFQKLEEIIGKLEEEDISLEEAFENYARGMEILLKCNEQIDRVEKQVMKLSVNGELEKFGDEDEDY